ncbi:MAG: proton-conducting transporter membrane subunit, partial [Methylocystaceae bacterium]
FFYSLIYVFANLGAFTILMRVESEQNSSDIAAFSGLSKRSPLMAAVMTVCLLSLAGIPPMAGFVGKWYLFSGAVQSGYIWLALIGLIMSMVSVYYYLSVALKMYTGEPQGGAIGLVFGEKVAVWACFLLTLISGIYPAPIIAMARLAWAAIAG